MRTIRVLVVVLVTASTLTFVGGTASAQQPTLTVMPNTDLVSGQTVTASGADWLASRSVVIAECTYTRTCVPLGETTTDAAGTFTHQVVVQRIVNGIDCLPAGSSARLRCRHL